MLKEEMEKIYLDINKNNEFKFEGHIFVNLPRHVEK